MSEPVYAHYESVDGGVVSLGGLDAGQMDVPAVIVISGVEYHHVETAAGYIE